MTERLFGDPGIDSQLGYLFDPEWHLKQKLEILQEAEKFSFAELERPYEQEVKIYFDDADVTLKLVPTQEEHHAVLPEQALLARVIKGDYRAFDLPFGRQAYLLIDGASVQNTMNNTQGMIAKDCNLSFRPAEYTGNDYLWPKYSQYPQINDFVPLGLESKFTVPIRQVMYGNTDEGWRTVFSVEA